MGFAVGVVALVRPVMAAAVDFRPILTFGVFHSGNVQIIGNEAIGDDTAVVAVDLAIDRTMPSSLASFYYQGAYVAYRQNTGLNYLGNRLGASYTKELSLRTGARADVEVSRTDSQGIAAASIAPQGSGATNVGRPLTFVPRTTITRGYGSASGTVGTGERSLADWAVQASISRYDDVPGVIFNDSNEARASGGWRYELSQRTTLGLTAGVNWFGFELTASSVGQWLAFTGTHELDQFTTMTFDLGAARTTTGDLSSNSGRFLLSFSRELIANSSLTAAVQQVVSPGTGLQAVTNDTGAWVSYTQSSVRSGLIWAADGSYWFRKTLPVEGGSTTETGTLSLSAALGWRFNRFLDLSAAYASFSQNDRNDSSSPLNTQYASYGLFLRWAIRGLNGAPNLGGRVARGR